MSRDIPGSLHAKEEKELLHGNDGKLLFTGYEGNMGAFLFAGGRLRGAMNLDSLTGIRPGNIYLPVSAKKCQTSMPALQSFPEESCVILP